MPAPWLLYGANGFTGKLIAAEAARRGMRPILAGREPKKIEPLGRELNCPTKIFSLDDPQALAAELTGVKAVLHCAGPFSATSRPMVEGCLAAGAHYLDITGEIDAIEAAAARHDRARAAGVCLIPAVGFDVVPSDCLAAMLAERQPGSVRLQMAFTFRGSASPGTLKTMLEAIPAGARVREDGKIVAKPLGWRALRIPFPDGPRSAMIVPWGDVASAWHTTGVPNIEVYLAVPKAQIVAVRLFRPLLAALRWRPLASLARRAIGRLVRGPSAKERETARAGFWGRAIDAEGRSIAATLATPGGYPLTVWTALGALERVLAGSVAPGFSTPARAFGSRFILEHPQAEFRQLY